MAKTWTAERDQKLLLLLLDQINVTGGIAAATAAAWKTTFVDTKKDTYQPTARAVTEHLNQLKATVYGKGSGGTPRGKATPKSTPRKAPTTKTKISTRGTKRKRGKMSSDEEDEHDDDEDEDNTDAEREALETTTPNSRSSLPRRSKVAKSYQQYDDSSDEDEEDEEDEDLPDGEYDFDAEREKLNTTPSKARPSPKGHSKSTAKSDHEDDEGGEGDDGNFVDALEDAEITVAAGSHPQDEEGGDDDESANLPKVTMSAPTAPEEEGVNFFAAKDSDEADRLVQTQRVTKERPANASSGGFDLSWLWAPLMSYPRDTWFGLVLALIWIGQMLVEPFELMIVAALIWEVQGEAKPVPVRWFILLACILTCIVLTALEIAFWMVDALHPYTFLGFQVFKATFWLVYFPLDIASTVMVRVIASQLIWGFWWILQTVFLSLGLTATLSAFIYGAWVAHTYKD